VPANAADWQVDPFSGEIKDGCIWGRGAIDMKDMDAMMLAVVRAQCRTTARHRPRLHRGRGGRRRLWLLLAGQESAGPAGRLHRGGW